MQKEQNSMPNIQDMRTDEVRNLCSQLVNRPNSAKIDELMKGLGVRSDWVQDPVIRKFAFRVLEAKLPKLPTSDTLKKALRVLTASSNEKTEGLANLVGKDPSYIVEAMIIMEDGSPNALCGKIINPIFTSTAYGADLAKRNAVVDAMISLSKTPYGIWNNNKSGILLASFANDMFRMNWGGAFERLLKEMSNLSMSYALAFLRSKSQQNELKEKTVEAAYKNATTAQSFCYLTSITNPNDWPKMAYSFLNNPATPEEQKNILFDIYVTRSFSGNEKEQAVYNVIFAFFASSTNDANYKKALMDFMKHPFPEGVASITGNLDKSIEHSEAIWDKIKNDPAMMSNCNPTFMTVASISDSHFEFNVDIDNEFTTSSWYGRHLIVEASVFDWKNLSETGQAVFKVFILVALGTPIGIAMMNSGVSGSDIAKHNNLAKPAAQIVRMKDTSEDYKKMVDTALESVKKDPYSDNLSKTWKDIEPQKLQTQITTDDVKDKLGRAILTQEEASLIAERADTYTYLRQRMGEKEYGIISQVADEAGLDALQKKLLLSIRIIENGRPGKEMGQGDYQPEPQQLKAMWNSVEKENGVWRGNPEAKVKHPARRYEGDFDKSLRLQAQWAAGTIKKRFNGSIASFAQRYCRGNWFNWFNFSKEFLLSTESRKS